MRPCPCPRPQRDARDRLRCSLCGGWAAAGTPLTRSDFTRAAEEATSLLENAVAEYAWLEGALYGLQRRGSLGPSSGTSDPTGVQVAAQGLDRARSWASLASRLLARALEELQRVDEAVGEARYAVDYGPPVKVDHVSRGVPCPKCKGAGRLPVIPEGRPDLVRAYAAAGQRAERGEAVPR